MLSPNFTPFPILETERLVLRKVGLTDLNELFFLRSDPTVIKYLDKAPATSLTEVSDFLKKITDLKDSGDAVDWAITLKDDPKLIGTICLWNINKEHYRAEIGYALHLDYHGKGIMQEAVLRVLNYGFRIIGLHSIEATVNPSNIASIKLLEKNNFAREGYYRENYFFNGKFLDTAVYSLLKTEFSIL